MHKIRARLIACALVSSLAFGAVLGESARAEACSCAGPNHARDVRTFAVSFRGVAQSVRQIDRETEEVTFSVTLRWRGVAVSQRAVSVRRNSRIVMCPIPSFRVGQRYAVYAQRGAGGVLTVGACNPSHAE